MRVRVYSGYSQHTPPRFAVNQIVFLLFMLLFFSFFSGCRRSAEELPVLPPATHPLSRDYIGYGVVNVSFTHLLNEPGSGGTSLTYLRRGTVLRIIERRTLLTLENSELWVLAEGNSGADNSSRGWLREAALDIFDSESRAKTASEAMNL